MTRILLTLALAIGMSVTALAQNQATITQVSANNQAEVIQNNDGEPIGHTATVTQQGTGSNTAYINQSFNPEVLAVVYPAYGGISTIFQDGYDNDARVTGATAESITFQSQEGDHNEAKIEINRRGGFYGDATVTQMQTGSHNFAHAYYDRTRSSFTSTYQTQVGDYNEARSFRVDDNSLVIQHQTSPIGVGAGNGNYAWIEGNQQDDNTFLQYQDGERNRVEFTVGRGPAEGAFGDHAQHNYSYANQIGSDNRAYVYQFSSHNSSTIIQTGTNNLATVAQGD